MISVFIRPWNESEERENRVKKKKPSGMINLIIHRPLLRATKHLYKRVGPSVGPLRLFIYPPMEVFRRTWCRVSGLVLITD